MNKDNPEQNSNPHPVPPQGFNPIWALIGMGVLIGLILLAEALGLKPK